MKFWKRMLTLAMTLALTLTLVSCGGMSEGSRTDGIYYDATGVSPDAVLMQIDGVDVPAERYFYWLYNSASNAAMYCGTDGFGEDAGDGRSYGQVCLDLALQNAKELALVEKWALENELTIPEEEMTSLMEEIDAYEEQYGEFGFNYMGVTRETMEYFYQEFAYYDLLLESVMVEGGAMSPTEEELKAYVEASGLMKADHILLATKDLVTGEPLDEAAVQAQYEKAQEILSELQAAEDLEETFQKLGDEYSEDTGRAVYPDGYIFGEGEMVIEFEEAAKALAVGEISGIVESDFGYHILLRKEVPVEEVLTEEGYFSYLLEKSLAEVEVKFSDLYNEKVATLDVGAFYNGVTDARDALFQEYQASLETEGSGEESGEGTEEDTEEAVG